MEPKKAAPQRKSEATTLLSELQVGSKFAVVSKGANAYGSVVTKDACLLTAISPNSHANFLTEKGEQGVFYDPKSYKVKPADFNINLDNMSVRHVVGSTGSDPEIFMAHGDGSLFPAFEFLPKQKPGLLTPYYDGFQAEFGIKAQGCHGWSGDYLRSGLESMLFSARAKDPKAKFLADTVVQIDPVVLEHTAPEFVALGCMPSENAYGDSGAPVPEPRELPVRFAGGHVHFGFPNSSVPKPERLANMVKWMDFFAAVPAVAMFENVDNPVRRIYYGRAGEYRAKPYGLEYRTLSNAWLFHPVVMHAVWNLARTATGYEALYPNYSLLAEEAEVRDIVNNSDVPAARKFLAKHKGLFDKYAENCWSNYNSMSKSPEFAPHKLFWAMVNGGVESVFPTLREVEKNWRIGQSWSAHTHNDKLMFYYACNRYNDSGKADYAGM